jgi:predicted AAA+ superfamily ATPase
LTLLAARLGGPVAVSDLSRTLGIPHSTLTRHLGLLEALFLLVRLPAWSSNLGTRLAKAPKWYLTDTGLAAHLLGASAEALIAAAGRAEPLFEALIVNELIRQAGWSRLRVRFHQLRTYSGREVDLVLEMPGGRCVGIEVKLSATVTGRDIAGLRTLAETAGPAFHRGIVLYTGQHVVPFAHNLHALPVSALWHGNDVSGL